MRENRVPPLLIALLAVPCLVVLATGPVTQHLDAFKTVLYFLSTAVLAAVWLLWKAGTGRTLAVPRIAVLYAAFALLSLMSLAWSRTVYDTALYLGLHVVNLAFLLLVGNLVESRRDVLVSAAVLSLLLAAVSAIGFLEALGLIVPYGRPSAGRIASTLGNPAYLGGFLNPALPPVTALAAAAFVSALRGVRKRLWTVLSAGAALAAACGVVALGLTASRAPIIGAGFGLVVFAACAVKVMGRGESRRLRRGMAVAAGILLPALAAASIAALLNPLLLERFASFFRFDGEYFRVLFADRIAAWTAALRIWLSDPPVSVLFGRGLGGYYALGFTRFPSDYRLLADVSSFKHAHCEYLELMADGGLVSLLSWLLAVGYAFRCSIRVIRRREADAAQRLLAAGFMAGIAGALLQNVVDLAMRTAAVQAVFWLLAGLCEANHNAVFREDAGRALRPIAVRGRGPVLALAAVLLSLLSAASVHAVRYALSEAAVLRAFHAPDREESLSRFREAARWNPRNIYALYETLWIVSEDPRAAIAMADKVESIIPGFRRTRWVKGMAQTLTGDFRGAAETLSLYLGQDEFDSDASLNLAACRVLLGDPDGAASALRDFLLAQNRIFMKERGSWFDLRPRELRLDAAAPANGRRMEGASYVVVLSMPYLERIARLLADRRDGGYDAALSGVTLAAAGLLDELDYADVGMGYYAKALEVRRLDAASEAQILGKALSWYERAVALKKSAWDAGDKALEARANGFLRKYLGFLLAIRPEEAWRRELDSLPP